MSESKPPAAAATSQQEKSLEPEEAVKLLNQGNDSNSNNGGGQAVVNLPNVTSSGSSGVGMSKKELMKYANDPFWVRLRTFLFVLFWVVWVAMLVGAVLIIALAPGCPATASLPWWKKCALARVEVKLPTGTGATPKEVLTSATAQLRKLEGGLKALKEANLDALIVSGLDAFFLDPTLHGSENGTEEVLEKFRDALTSLNAAVHGDEVKAKILYALTLDQTSVGTEWHRKSADDVKAKISGGGGELSQNSSTSSSSSSTAGYYLWRKALLSGTDLIWKFNVDNRLYFGTRSTDQVAALNYGDAALKEKMRALVLSWVRSKVDGIQVDGDFYVDPSASVDDSSARTFASAETLAEVRKWIKSGGENKALLVSGSSLTGGLLKSHTEANYFELAPEGGGQGGGGSCGRGAAANKTTDGTPAAAAPSAAEVKAKIGLGWRSFTVDYPANKGNRISVHSGLTMAEAVLTAVHLLPKSNPIIVTEASADTSASPTSTAVDSLAHLGRNRLLADLTRLRREQSESFMLGSTILPEVMTHNGKGEVLAVTRVYKQKNAYLLVINFASTSQEFEVKGGAGVGFDREVSVARVVLADSQNLSIVGKEVDIAKLKLEPKSFLLVELAPRD
ncbi:hypothetical protein TYRP_020640 [Tyrophagus putrescentiae]|nr:hypothetical protein TYRP_020640 [Tyrophagus putrescentiae]